MNIEYRNSCVALCVAQYGWTLSEAKANVGNFFDRFLPIKDAANDVDDRLLVAPPLVEQVWRVALLYTKEYDAHCHNAIGRFMHHRPAEQEAEQEAEADTEREARYRDTHWAHIFLFGEPDSRIWPPVAHALATHSAWVTRLPGCRSDMVPPATTLVPTLQKRKREATSQIFVKNIMGRTLVLDRCLSDTVAQVKEELAIREGIAVENQRLIYGGKQLDDKTTLTQNNITKEATLHLVLRMKGC
jgi:hypothetical protein